MEVPQEELVAASTSMPPTGARGGAGVALQRRRGSRLRGLGPRQDLALLRAHQLQLVEGAVDAGQAAGLLGVRRRGHGRRGGRRGRRRCVVVHDLGGDRRPRQDGVLAVRPPALLLESWTRGVDARHEQAGHLHRVGRDGDAGQGVVRHGGPGGEPGRAAEVQPAPGGHDEQGR